MAGLSGLRVLDLSTRPCGALAGKLLAGFGADVVRVVAPDAPHDPAAEVWYDEGKRRETIDLTTSAGRDRLLALAPDVDVIVETFKPGVMASLGLDPVTLRSARPELVICSITNFGQTGPRAQAEAEDITLYAMSGLMNSTGDHRRAPLNAGSRIAQATAGIQAYTAILIALYRRIATGRGDWIDVSIQEAAADNIENILAEYLHAGKVAKRNNDEHLLMPWRTFPCKDGHAAILGGPVRHWASAVSAFEEPRLCEPRLAHMADRIKNREEVRDLMKPWLMSHTRREIYEAGQKRKLAWAYLATLDEVATLPQLLARRYVVDTATSGGKPCKTLGAPFRGEKLPWGGLRMTDRRGWFSNAPVAPTKRPLEGIRVIDFTHDWAGPHTTRILADFGADVIKVEYPKRLCMMRGGALDKINAHPRWWQMHRGKKSITLDFDIPEHVDAARQLMLGADLVVENGRPGVMTKWGLDAASLRAENPFLIYLSMSAFGATGPESANAGYGGCLEAICGLQSLTAYSADGDRYRVREADVTNGAMGAAAAMTALVHRARTGEGQWIDLAQQETCMILFGEEFVRFTLEGRIGLPRGNRHDVFTQGCYPCAGEDRWITLCIRSDDEWRRFCELAGNPAWAADARWTTAAGRREHHDALDESLSAWTKALDAVELADRLQGAGFAAGAVHTAADLAKDPHLAARGWWLVPEKGGGKPFPGVPFHMAEGVGAITWRGADLGAHNEEILCGDVGWTKDRLPSLTDGNVRLAFDLA